MLAYLVTSAARRRLLELLWRHDVVGSASALAKQAHVGFATAYRELKRLEEFGLVSTRVVDGREEYFVAADHPDADLFRRLVTTQPAAKAPTTVEAERTRGGLRALGAPLSAPPSHVADSDREQVLVDAVHLAHRDATLARVLPVALWHQWTSLNHARLEERAHCAREKHSLGFVIALTSRLSGDPALETWAERLRDHRVTGLRSFFELPSARSTRALAERRTPAVAREWGFLMDLDYDSFKSTFEKSTSDAG
jgi:hypothetical protein